MEEVRISKKRRAEECFSDDGESEEVIKRQRREMAPSPPNVSMPSVSPTLSQLQGWCEPGHGSGSPSSSTSATPSLGSPPQSPTQLFSQLLENPQARVNKKYPSQPSPSMMGTEEAVEVAIWRTLPPGSQDFEPSERCPTPPS